MRADHELQKTVLEHLDFDPAIDACHIGVAVRDGVVTLTGHVSSLGEKRAAAFGAGQVRGVKAVVDEIAIELPGRCETDDEILGGLAHARLASNRALPRDRIHLVVEDGVIMLRGEVDWQYQRVEAEQDLHKLDGIRDIRNEIVVKPPVKVAVIRARVHDALARLAPLHADNIKVGTRGTTVTLSGAVTSWHERGLAESAAWSVPGVTQVDNKVTVV